MVGYSKKLQTTEQLITKNDRLCQQIIQTAIEYYDIDRKELEDHIRQAAASGRLADRISVSQALKHIVRDWTAEGVHERQTFPCLLDTLVGLFPNERNQFQDQLRVLVPGAGLGRLGYEIAALGGRFSSSLS